MPVTPNFDNWAIFQCAAQTCVRYAATMKTRSSADTDTTDSSTDQRARASKDNPDDATDGQLQTWPERSSSCWSQLTFSYVTPLLRRGAQKTLDPDDLWRASDEERVRTLRSCLLYTSPSPRDRG